MRLMKVSQNGRRIILSVVMGYNTVCPNILYLAIKIGKLGHLPPDQTLHGKIKIKIISKD